jgi:hypothetical protein
MKVHFSQIYIEQGAECPFNSRFNLYIAEQVTSLVEPSTWFSAKYGGDWKLIFRISARWSPDENDTERGVKLSESARTKLARFRSFTSEPLRVELRGPTVFKKDKDVEYSIFLPFRRVIESETPPVTALNYIFAGVYAVLEELQINTSKLRAEVDRIIERVCSDPTMFTVNPRPESGIGPPVWPVVSKT